MMRSGMPLLFRQ